MSSKALTIYDAAAGAGKTYTLVKNYLIKVLGSKSNNRYKQILAITFTNKAVSEMKERILSTLFAFSIQDISSDNSMFDEIKQTLNIDATTLKERSLEVLNFILHNYTAFSVQTIDKFTQSIIRTFAFDLNLSNSFEVQLDQKIILEEAVDQLLMEVGKDQKVTTVVLEYVSQQIEDDKSWDIKQLLFDLGMILFREGDQKQVESLSKVSSETLFSLNDTYQKLKEKNQRAIKKSALELLDKIQEEAVIDDFSRGTLPRYFKKLSEEGTFPLRDFILKDIAEVVLYAKSKDDLIKAKIDGLRPEIEAVFNATKALIFENKCIEGIIKNLPAMSLLNFLSKKIDHLKKEKNQVLISEFNTLIAQNIKDQPTPFIYERLGEKYKEFFIDEFQDTSEVQWDNLIPLIDNALSSYIENTEQTGTATLVGDAKQSIYRWRGGKAEQFIELSLGYTPFSNSEKELLLLDTNYRSYSEIITFNNDFFTYLSDFITKDQYKELYRKGNQQKTNPKKGGYISFECFAAKTKAEKDEVYPEAVKCYIDEALEDGFSYSDIAILVRKNSEAVTISNFLITENIPVISSESLLVKNADEVRLLESVLQYISDPDDGMLRLRLINTLFVVRKETIGHEFLKELLEIDNRSFEKNLLEKFEIRLPQLFSNNRSVFSLIEELCEIFKLNISVSSNLQFFMDFAFDFSNTSNGSLQQFIDFWDSKKDTLSIITSEEQEGVQIMTIHKSKGLEFPIVILPFLEDALYAFKAKNIWIKNLKEDSEIDQLYWSFNRKVFEYYNTSLVENADEVLASEELDTLNVLYVAFTRAVRRLYLLGDKTKASVALEKGNIISFVADFFKAKSICIEEDRYCIGERMSNDKDLKTRITTPINDFLYRKIDHLNTSASLSNHNQKSEAVEKGELIHLILSRVFDRADVSKVLENIEESKLMNNEDIDLLKAQILELINHSEFSSFFNQKNRIYNERDFYLEGTLLRPDRIEISPSGEAMILDYKTGAPQKKYHEQLSNYLRLVSKLGYKNVKKYLVYFDQALKIIEV